MAKSKTIKTSTARKGKTMAKAKSSKFGKISKAFSFSTTKGKFLVFMLTFAVVGGGYAAYQAFAATSVPADLSGVLYSYGPFTAGDGVKGVIDCSNAAGQTGYGPLRSCIQQNPANHSQYRTGLWSVVTKGFSPTSGWLNDSSDPTTYFYKVCKNMDNYFSGTRALDTGYGPISYGQIFRTYYNPDSKKTIWQIKWANRSTITGNCSVNGNWMDAKGW